MKVAACLMVLLLMSCSSGNKLSKTNTKQETPFVPQYTPGPQALIYKTRKDYSNNVPVLLSDDKSAIISYPHPNDLKADGRYQTPTFLNNGYLLDNRGIGKNVAFLKLTYQEYSQLENPPPLAELYSYIIDKEPLTELCDCGNRTAFTEIEKQLNTLIDDKQLHVVCKVIK